MESFSHRVKAEIRKKHFTVPVNSTNIEIDRFPQEKRRTALQEAFLAMGSATDPHKDYHLQFLCRDSKKVESILEELSFFGLHPKRGKRGSKLLIYFKDAEEISDVLKLLNAHDALLEFENVRILKEVSENVNRRVNFEAANIQKTVRAGMRQLRDIRLIQERLGREQLEPMLRELAELREKHPELSLEELGKMMDPPISKSAVNHRMRKLQGIARNLREKGNRSEGLPEED